MIEMSSAGPVYWTVYICALCALLTNLHSDCNLCVFNFYCACLVLRTSTLFYTFIHLILSLYTFYSLFYIFILVVIFHSTQFNFICIASTTTQIHSRRFTETQSMTPEQISSTKILIPNLHQRKMASKKKKCK